MFGWFCFFGQHKFWHVKCGIYQCSRCKELSVGVDRDALGDPVPVGEV